MAALISNWECFPDFKKILVTRFYKYLIVRVLKFGLLIETLWCRKNNIPMKRFFVILNFYFFLSAGPALAQAHVQTNTLFQMSVATTIASTFAAPSTSGNLIVVHLDWNNQAINISSVTDNKGNSYARISGPTNWNGALYRAELWYAYNITGGGGAIKVTATLSGAPSTFSQIYISEYSGIISAANPLDKSSVLAGSTLAVSSGPQTTTYNHELIYGASIGASGNLTKGASFTLRSGANNNVIEDKNAAATGLFDANFTSASGNWIAQMATFISTSSNFILPVDFSSFTGQCKNDQVVLDWSTANEMNNDYFTIEKSGDENSWIKAGTVKSKGNSSTSQYYSFIPENNNDERTWYRIKQTDLDGREKYSEIISVRSCGEPKKEIEIYPNPTNGITLSGKINTKTIQPWSIVIYDKLGNVIMRSTSDQAEFTLYFPHTLRPGIYYAGFSSGTLSRSTAFMVRN